MKSPDDNRVLVIAAGAAVAVGTLLLYLGTVAPTVLPFDPPEIHDAEMIQMQVCTLSITHPTGYPTYLTLAHLVTYLPFGDCAYRSNVASALFGSLAVMVVYSIGYVLSRRIIAAVIGAFAFGVGTTFWSQSVMAEVYTANALFVALAILIFLLWRRNSERRRLLILGALCIGLAITNHMTSALLLPAALLLVVLVDPKTLLRVRLMFACLLAFLAGLVPYIYLPIRARTAPMIANDPDNLERFLFVVSGGDLRGGFFAFGPTEIPGRIVFYAGHLLENFHWGLIAIAVAGLGALITWDRPVAAFTGFLFAGWTFHAIQNDISDIEVYFIPTYLVVAVWVSGGVGLLLDEADSLLEDRSGAFRIGLAAVLSVLILTLPLAGVGGTYARNDMSDDYRARELIETVASDVPRGATVLHLRSNLWYMVLVEERRRDLTLVDPFQGQIPGRFNDVVWPERLSPQEKRDRYGIYDPSGVTAAVKASRRNEDVYVLAHENLNLDYFRRAGFSVEGVEGDLYHLVPPGSREYARLTPAERNEGGDGRAG